LTKSSSPPAATRSLHYALPISLALVLVAFNYLVTRVPARVDLADGKLYTLAEGTKKILRNLQAPVKVKLYISQGESVPVPLRSLDRKSTRLNSSHRTISYAVFC